MRDMRLEEVKTACLACYHGDGEKEYISFAAQAVAGQGQFIGLWDKEPEGGPTDSLTLKVAVSRKEDARYCSGSAVAISSVSHANQSSETLIDGRAIFNLATNALKNCKKMLADHQQFLKNGELPSGTNDDDLDKYIINGMYRDLKGTDATNNAEIELAASEEAKNEEDEEFGEEAPTDWSPPGWFAFKIFVPHALHEFRSELVAIGDWPKNKRGDGTSSDSRNAAREAALKQKEVERRNDSSNDMGLPKRDFIIMSQEEARMDQREHEANILALTQVLESLHKRMDVLSKILARFFSSRLHFEQD
mmetsp:Transcript_4745/g.7038  ORF Transcript_4745/g.7038 Transcript_4745/m.7038 type:complete len:306 (+) Transcript_4745:286-1203(+)